MVCLKRPIKRYLEGFKEEKEAKSCMLCYPDMHMRNEMSFFSNC